MKNEFIGYYRPTKEEKDSAWKTGVFIFDTNALLNLYRYSETTRKDFLTALEKIKERLHLPYHVASEFHKNRHGVIEDSTAKYDSLLDGIQEVFKKNIEQHFNQVKKHPSIDINPLKKLSDIFLSDLKKELKKQKSDHPDHHSKDEILDSITELFSDKVGVKFTEKELEEVFKEGKERYEKKIPPGYKDNINKSNGNEYGDLIVWKEIIKYAKTNKQPIVFVTDDQKEDWWTIEKGFPIRPREELIKEFLDETGIRILIYNADRFLRAAKRRKLVESIDPKSLDEVLNFSKSKIDEVIHYQNIDSECKYEDFIDYSNFINKNFNKKLYNSDLLETFMKNYNSNTKHSFDLKYLKDIDQNELLKRLNIIKHKSRDDDNFGENLVEV